MRVSDILNFIQVDARTGLGGQPSEAQLRALPAAGYAVVVNLAPTTVIDGQPIDEAAILRELGVDYRHIPVAWAAPDLADYTRFVAAMDDCSGRQILVHCAMNYRVTAFYALFAMERLGWSEDQADTLIARIWSPHASYQMSDAWKDLIAEVKALIRARA